MTTATTHKKASFAARKMVTGVHVSQSIPWIVALAPMLSILFAAVFL